MTESAASWITLSAFILCAIILFARSKDFSGNNILLTLLTSAICCIGGFLITAMIMKASGGIDSPMVNSLLVVAGSLICVAGKEFVNQRRETQ